MWYDLRHSIYGVRSLTRQTVSQFTLLASTKKGNKPDFHGAAKAEHAKELYDYFYASVQNLYTETRVKNGVFQAMMEVGLVNDGPVRTVLPDHSYFTRSPLQCSLIDVQTLRSPWK